MKVYIAAIAALVILAGCGRAPGGPLTASGYKLYEAASTQSSRSVAVIDSRSHSVERSLPLGTASPDWTHLYTLTATTLTDIDPQTGATLHTLQVPGYFNLPPATISDMPGGLSQNGKWLVLDAPAPAESHLLLIDTTYATKPAAISLQGSFRFDAVSNDGRRIYMIQQLSSTNYYVRFFDMASMRLDPTIVFDKSDGQAAMSGLRLSGVASPDGHWLYSLYAREHKGPFIHALSLDNPLAFCIDLPGGGYNTPGGSGDGLSWSLALSADGSHLYAGNSASGTVAEVNTNGGGPPSVTRTVHITTGQSARGLVQDVKAKELGASGVALSPDGRTLVMSGNKGVVWLDTATLTARSWALMDWTVWSLALSPDGKMVYAISDAGMIAELPMSGSHSPTTFGGAPGQPLALVRVESVSGP